MPEPEVKKFQVIVNDQSFYFTEEELSGADIIQTGPQMYHILADQKSVEVSGQTIDGKMLGLTVNGSDYTVEIRTPLDQMLDQMGFNAVNTRVVKEIRAPMPGLVLDISVKEGDQLTNGQRVVILEAMKMENSIVMHGEAVVKKVWVSRGQAVEKGQVLVELE
jgi:biotin carboxyl carrier protein